MVESIAKYKKVFKWISFGILLVVVFTIFVSMGWQFITDYMVDEGKITEESLIKQGIKLISDKIYKINSVLCIISICSAVAYLIGGHIEKSNITYNKKKSEKKLGKEYLSKLKNAWPCVLLVLFMLWTAVGCIQASMEASAEAVVKAYPQQVEELEKGIAEGKIENGEEIKKELDYRLQESLPIANWSSGDRMSNAADRGWNGCTNLKDGYFSFLFYAMVVVNVMMLGAKSDKLKQWIIRLLIMSAFVLILLSFFNLIMPKYELAIDLETEEVKIYQDTVIYNRAIFNNSNHYGYYLCIVVMLCATMFMKEKNIYFKGMSLICFILSTFMLVVNNTFGAYLGVMVALGIMVVCILGSFLNSCFKFIYYKHVKSENVEEMLNKLKYNSKEVLKMAILTIIFVGFSLTITGAESKVYTENNYLCKKSYIGTIFGERNILIKDNGANVILTDSKFTISGDSDIKTLDEKINIQNRVYSVNEKKLKLVLSSSEIKPDAAYYKLNNKLYEILSDNTTQRVQNNHVTTIVERNFTNLLKDIKIIFASNDENEEKQINVNEVISGETVKNSGEISGNTKDEEYNEKSGLSEAVSNTGSGRGEVWIKSFDLIEQRPIFGWGLENLLNEFYHQYGINEGRTHNLILQLAGTTGIVGMLLYIGAVIAIFFKLLFKFTLREYTKETRIILLGVYIIAGSLFYILTKQLLDVLLINVCITVLFEVLLILITNVKKIKLRTSNWGLIEYVAMPTFIAYMVSSLFGNSAFYTSPYFMIILGMMIASMIYKSSNEVSLENDSETKNIYSKVSANVEKANVIHKDSKIANKKTENTKKESNAKNIKSQYTSKKKK